MKSTAAVLTRGLTGRHIRFIALGSAIGTGLFYGSAEAIQKAGPSVLLAYLIGGAIIYIVLRALGEMAVSDPVSGSFGEYASKHLGPLAGFMTGWTYTFEMIVVCLADVTAFGIYMGFWFPDVPRWIWALSIIFFIGAINLVNVKLFGEVEFSRLRQAIGEQPLVVTRGGEGVTLVTAHGGTVSVQTAPDRGSRFRVRLPRTAELISPAQPVRP
mgnify:CR=1 FL=1